MELKRIEDYIKVYDDIIPGNLCDELIAKYQQSDPEFVDTEGRPKFHHLTLDHDISKSLLEIVRVSLVKYANSTGLISWMPEKYAVEDFRIKRYRMGTDDRFLPHVDVGDYASARRFLAFFMYLNTVKEGGETKFTTINKKVKPKRGRLLIFPPLWNFPHEGRPTISEDKYIVGSYLHYI